MGNLQKVAVFYIVALLLMTYGYAVGRFQVYPFKIIEPLVKDYEAFAEGDKTEQPTTVLEKFQNDVGISFKRITYDYPEAADDSTVEVMLPTQSERRGPALIYVHPDHQQGYRAIVGAFDMEESLWGAMLFDGTGQPIHHWNLSTEHLPDNREPDQNKNLYPAYIFQDGSVIFNMAEAGGGIVKVDACGKEIWNLPGSFHHVVQPDEHGYFWSFIGTQIDMNQDMVKVSVETGEIVKTIMMEDVREANPEVAIWNLHLMVFNKAKANMSHANDVEPLPSYLVDKYPLFEEGDLVISYAVTNNVFVLDPDTLKVKWWRIGQTDLQHDPDWEPSGNIVLFSNNSRTKGTSDIVAIDPVTLSKTILFDGAEMGVFTNINGDHQLTSWGTRMVVSSTQGWAFELDESGKVIFSFVNATDIEERQALHLSRGFHFDADYFTSRFWETCTD